MAYQPHLPGLEPSLPTAFALAKERQIEWVFVRGDKTFSSRFRLTQKGYKKYLANGWSVYHCVA